jgi:hypothetical protein
MDELRTTPKKKGLPGWLIVVFAIGGLFGICAIASFFGAVGVLVPRIQSKQQQTTCALHLRSLGNLYVQDVLTSANEPEQGGTAYLLRLVRDAQADGKWLLCPGHERSAEMELTSIGPFDPYALDEPALRAACSYAVRDFARFPLAPGDDGSAFIAADMDEHHRDGVNVLLSDGGVYFHDRASLGLAPSEPIIVGPDSPHPELAKLCIVPAR